MNETNRHRHWIQVTGKPLPPLAEALRRELEDMDVVEMTPHTNRAVIKDEAGAPMCVIDWMPDRLGRLQTIAAGEQPEPQPEKGDTVIRKISAEEAAKIQAAGGYRVINADAPEVPSIDLPDYHGTLEREERRAIGEVALWVCAVLGLLICGGYLIADFMGAI